MIPANVIRFLEDRANAAFAGTRDRNLVPCGHRVPGWQIEARGRLLVACIPAASATRMLEEIRDGDPIAITFEEVGTHETYQVKGRYRSHRAAGPAEIASADRVRERFVKGLRALYGDDRISPLVRASVPVPSMALEIEVQ